MSFKEKAITASNQELAEMLNYSSVIARACAISELGERLEKKFNTRVFDLIVQAIKAPQNRTQRIKGLISVAHFGMSVLGKLHYPEVKIVLTQLLQFWDETDKQDLLWFLENEGIKINEMQKTPTQKVA